MLVLTCAFWNWPTPYSAKRACQCWLSYQYIAGVTAESYCKLIKVVLFEAVAWHWKCWTNFCNDAKQRFLNTDSMYYAMHRFLNTDSMLNAMRRFLNTDSMYYAMHRFLNTESIYYAMRRFLNTGSMYYAMHRFFNTVYIMQCVDLLIQTVCIMQCVDFECRCVQRAEIEEAPDDGKWHWSGVRWRGLCFVNKWRSLGCAGLLKWVYV